MLSPGRAPARSWPLRTSAAKPFHGAATRSRRWPKGRSSGRSCSSSRTESGAGSSARSSAVFERKQLRIVAAKLTMVSTIDRRDPLRGAQGKAVLPGARHPHLLRARLRPRPRGEVGDHGRPPPDRRHQSPDGRPRDDSGRPRPRRHPEPDPRVRLPDLRRTGDRTVLPAVGVPRVLPEPAQSTPEPIDRRHRAGRAGAPRREARRLSDRHPARARRPGRRRGRRRPARPGEGAPARGPRSPSPSRATTRSSRSPTSTAPRRAWLRRNLPGPYTALLPASAAAKLSLAPGIVGADGTIGIRIPAHPLARSLAELVGPVTSTSANRHGEPPARSVAEARRVFGSEVAVYLDGEPAPSGRPSELVDLTGAKPRPVRRG